MIKKSAKEMSFWDTRTHLNGCEPASLKVITVSEFQHCTEEWKNHLVRGQWEKPCPGAVWLTKKKNILREIILNCNFIR